VKLNYVGVFLGLALVIGVFSPWVSKGHESYGKVNLETGKLEIKYHVIYFLSPVYATKTIDGGMVERAWFVTSGLSISAGLLITSAVFFFVRFTFSV